MEEALSPACGPAGLVLLPPHLEGHRAAIEGAAGAPGRVLFATSGSSGWPKLVVHTAASLRASARAVNQHLGCGPGDVWLRAIPFYHVGGFALHLRAEIAGGRVEVVDAPWSPATLCGAAARCGATVLSLVPAQVYDLVGHDLRSPESLRAVVVGGGRLDPGLAARARDLGWPVLQSYGSSEAGSQVATEREPGGGLTVIDGWEARLSSAGELELRGPALFDGYWEADPSEAYRFRDPKLPDGWFATGDSGELLALGSGQALSAVGRLGRVVKVLGELVDLDALESAAGPRVAVVAFPDRRAGSRLVAVAEHGSGFEPDRFNESRPGFERITAVTWIEHLPRTGLGKVSYPEIVARVNSA